MLTRAFVLAAIGGALAWFPSAALEIQGASFFTNPPWRVELTAFYNTVWDPQPDHAFTVELPANAGAPLGGLTIQQTRGSDWWFPYDVERTSAYVGRPRAEGRKLPVTATFDPEIRRFEIRFDPPVAPGTTFTTVLKPWNNPDQADTYMFQVTAWPAGAQPAATPLGYATLRIYSLFY